MIFSPQVIDSKQRHLDSILSSINLVEEVVGAHLSEPFELNSLGRQWEPGGGATLFEIKTGSNHFFLKAKHFSVHVESKLESEKAFIAQSSLKNEYEFMSALEVDWVPRTIFYAEQSSYCFLATEWLDGFAETTANMSGREIMESWDTIYSSVHELYQRGIVHTDIHEKNIMFRGKRPVIIDFEEARYLHQDDLPFLESLDYQGSNRFGNVGEMPESDSGFAGEFTCLERLRKVFEKLVEQKLVEQLDRCSFDSACPFLTSLDHGSDDRIYQSINIKGLQITGQRPLEDGRLAVVNKVIDGLLTKPMVHVDIGSNLGMFNVLLAQRQNIMKSIGLEAFADYVDASRMAAFLAGCTNVEFHTFEAGRDSLAAVLGESAVDLFTVFSVYHHISDKEAFIRDLVRAQPKAILLEMAVQPECYDRPSWQTEVKWLADQLDMAKCFLVGSSSDFERPIVLLTKQAPGIGFWVRAFGVRKLFDRSSLEL